jgi:cation channel sperm-associated protein 3
MKKFERDLTLERNLAIMEEKQIILKRQQEEVNRLMNTQVGWHTRHTEGQ